MKKLTLSTILPRVSLKSIADQLIKLNLEKLSYPTKKTTPDLSQAGFTLIEMIVVVIIAGILSAIAVPSWTSFIDQRRANAVNDAVSQVLKQAQSEAKKNKFSYNVGFKTTGQVPQVAIYRTGSTAIWENLIKDSSIKPGQVILGTNISATNTVDTSITYGTTTEQAISFDYSGNLSSPSMTTNPIVVAVGVPTANNATTILAASRRCIKIVTLLGSMQTKQKSECNP